MRTPRTILITGASRGIGAAIARTLAADGHRLALCARRAESLAAIATELDALALPFDVTDRGALAAATTRAAAELGPVDVLVCNAGVAESAPLAKIDDAQFDRTLAINLTAPFHLARALAPAMVDRGWGRLIFVASNAGLAGYPYTAAYCASKHGVVGLMRALAAELATTGVTSNAVCPGFVETDMTTAAIERIVRTTGRDAAAARAALERMNPQRRLIQPDEVAHAVRHLIDDAARGVNGQALVVDGGQVMP